MKNLVFKPAAWFQFLYNSVVWRAFDSVIFPEDLPLLWDVPWKSLIFSVSVHLWRYEGGYPALNEVMSKLRQNKVKNTDFVTQKRAKNRQSKNKKADLDTKVSHPFL